MRLRTRLFLSISALITVALVGLLLGLVSVTQIAGSRERLINQAQGYRNDIIPRAKGQAAQVVNEAKGQAQARVARAEGEAARFVKTLKEYQQAKDVIAKRIYIETMEQVLSGVDKIILDNKTGDRVLPYLPLDRLQKRPRQAGSESGAERGSP